MACMQVTYLIHWGTRKKGANGTWSAPTLTLRIEYSIPPGIIRQGRRRSVR